MSAARPFEGGGGRPSLARRALRPLALLATVATLGGCALWPWSSSAPPLPELPEVTGSASVSVAWTVSMGSGAIGFQPVVVGDTIVAAGRQGVVAWIDAATGKTIWRTELGKPLIGGVGSDGDITVVAGRDGTLIALDRDGKEKWATPTGAEIVTVPAVGLGLVIARGSDNRVHAYDIDTGKRRWTFERQRPPLVLRQTAAIAMDPSTAYVGLPGGRLVALSLQSGALKWEAAVGMPRGSNEIERIADVVGSPLVSGNEVCAAAWQGRLACLDSATGRALWSRDLAAAAGIDLDRRLVVAVDKTGDVHGVSRTGASVWRQDKLRRRAPSAPLLSSAGVVVGDSLGLLHVLARDDGSLAARLTLDGTPVVGPPVGWRNLAVVQTTGGMLYAVAVE